MGEENKQFESLIELLKTKITEDGVTRVVQERLDTARKGLEEKRRRFLRSKVLYKVISDISMDPSCPMHTEIADNLTLAELSGCIDLGSTEGGHANSPGDRITTLALESDDIQRPPTSLQLQKVLKQSIEERLFDQNKALYLIVSQDNGTTELKASLLHPHLLRLHDKISGIVSSAKDSEKEMTILNSSLDEALRKQTNILTKMEAGLDVLINKHYKGSKLESTSVQVQYMRAKCETLRLKIKSLLMEVINTTYNKESVKAIKLVRTRTQEKIQRTEEELSELNNRITQYKGVSNEFSEVVQQYAKVLKLIEEKKWALRELTTVPAAL